MKKLLPILPALLALAFLSVGCTKPEDGKDKPGTTTGSTNAGEDGGDAVVKKSDAEDVGEELRHDAYQYYGLGNNKTLVYTLKLQDVEEEGEQEVAYQGLIDGVPTYKILRTGALSDLGDETLQLSEEGVKLSETSIGEVAEPSLALPAKIAVGDTWEDTQTITQRDGKDLVMKSSYKVEKEEKLTTDAGEFDTIYISSNGTITYDGSTRTFTGRINYAKGIGPVKLVIDAQTGENNETSSTVVTLKAVK